MLNIKKELIITIISLIILSLFLPAGIVYALRPNLMITTEQGESRYKNLEEINSVLSKDSRQITAYIIDLIDQGSPVPQILKDKALEKYYEEQKDIAISQLTSIKPDNAKYDSNGEPLKFEGITVVSNLTENNEFVALAKAIIGNREDPEDENHGLPDLKEPSVAKWQKDEKLDKPFIALVPLGSEHITIYDGVCIADYSAGWKYDETLPGYNETQKEIELLQKTENLTPEEAAYRVIQRRIFNALTGLKDSVTPRFKPIGIAAFPPEGKDVSVLILNVGPVSIEDLIAITRVHEAVKKATGIKNFGPFKGHATIGYFINPVSETNIREFKNYLLTIDKFIKEHVDRYIFELPAIELSRFRDMESFPPVKDGTFSWKSQALSSNQFVTTFSSEEARDISLVGGKAASLAELASIPGIDVPEGFSVTTKVYEHYLKQINAMPLIRELEGLSEQWKALDETNPKREKLTAEMRKVSEKIRNRILEGEISSDIRNMIITFYGNLEKNGVPALVAVRSSATAEDMPEASFAGQYKTYLNQQGDEQVIEAIKRVWASTYEMNPVEYRNRNNMQHSKNKMCALILEMVNPQSAGTAFTVDLETFAPFISINSTYGLGEAEVSGIVTSDTWVVDPNSNSILKRRIGEKEKKIVYDPAEKRNVTIDTESSERKRFAISIEMAKRIAVLVNKIQNHYVGNNKLKYMDIEYAITDDGRIIFTQARPETVLSSGKKSLIAVDTKKIEERNRAAVKSGKEPPYPEIFKGGVSGSSGVTRGVLRVVSNVQEAESVIKPGDIMVAPNTTNEWEHVMGRTNGMITEVGGPGNHTAVVSREQGKVAIVGAVGAKESLKMYDGKMVTIDATFKRVYLNNVPGELEFNPTKIQPDYGGLYSQTLDESWKEVQDTGTTMTDPDGTRWIKKPDQQVSRFLQDVFKRSHRKVARMLGAKIIDRVKDGVYQVRFDTIYPWMTELAERPIEGPDSLSSIHEARVTNVRDFLQKSEDLELTGSSISGWFDSFISLNAYMGFAYNMYRITEGLLQEALKEKQIPEPYFSQLWTSMATWVGETEAIERKRGYGLLLEDVKEDKNLREVLREAVSKRDFDVFSSAYPEFYDRFNEHAFNYKIMKNTDDIFTTGDPLLSQELLAGELLRDADNDRTIGVYDTKPEQFYPDDLRFERIVRLAFLSEKLRQDAHHFKVRGQWKFAEVLRPLADFLIEKREIEVFGDIFDHPPEWIVGKVREYEEARFSAVPEEPLFHIKQYQIQDLQTYFTTMGRWKYEYARWNDASNELSLINATRIEEEVKPEFLENGQHLPRDITLSTRPLNEQEHSKVDNLAKDLGIDITKVVVIILDRAAAFNRIYGLYADGFLFIREDILSEGSQEQIREALHHLHLKPTGLDYEALKKIQYHGNLRDLITELSHRTIKEKLFAQSTVEESDLVRLKKDLGLSDRDYDFITREMVRRRISFEEAQLLLQEHKLREKVDVHRQLRMGI